MITEFKIISNIFKPFYNINISSEKKSI